MGFQEPDGPKTFITVLRPPGPQIQSTLHGRPSKPGAHAFSTAEAFFFCHQGVGKACHTGGEAATPVLSSAKGCYACTKAVRTPPSGRVSGAVGPFHFGRCIP